MLYFFVIVVIIFNIGQGVCQDGSNTRQLIQFYTDDQRFVHRVVRRLTLARDM